jgi:hypothetical protein
MWISLALGSRYLVHCTDLTVYQRGQRSKCIIFGASSSPLYSGRAPRSSRNLCAFPSIQTVKVNLKFGYEIAQVRLKIPSMASCAHEPSWKKDIMRVSGSGNIETTNRQLARHDQFHSFYDRPRIRVLPVHECHRCPGRLDHLRIFVLDPYTFFARLYREKLSLVRMAFKVKSHTL